MSKTIKSYLPYYLLFLTPFLIIPGIALVEISVASLILFFLFKNKSINYYKDFKFLFLIIFSIYVAINAFFQINDNLKYSSFFFFRFSLLSLSICFILDLNKSISNNIKKYILFFFIVFNILIFLDSYLQFLTGKNILGFEIIGSTISSIFGSELILGSFLIKLLPIIIFLFFYSNVDIKKYSLIIILFFSFYFSIIYLAGGRTPFFLMVLFIFFSIIFIKDLRSIFLKSLLILTIFISSFFVFEFGKSNPVDRIFVKTFSQITDNYFNKIKNDTFEKKREFSKEIKIFSSNHHGHYILAYDLFKQNPVWGIGPKGFRHYCRSVDYDPPLGICSTHPHNFLVQISLETGLIGLVFYLSGLIFVILRLLKGYWTKDFGERNCFLIISIGLIVNFFPFVPNGNFFNNWISIINFFYIGFYMYSYKKIFSS
jgi:O-antigen ligase